MNDKEEVVFDDPLQVPMVFLGFKGNEERPIAVQPGGVSVFATPYEGVRDVRSACGR